MTLRLLLLLIAFYTYATDSIIAYVNKHVITSHEFDIRYEELLSNIKKNTSLNTSVMTEVLKSQLLDQMILEQIQLDLAKKNNIKATDDEINAVITNNKLTKNVSRQSINDQIIIDKLKQREVNARIVVTDDEVNRIFNSAVFKERIEYHLGVLLFKSENVANSVYKMLESGMDFVQAAKQYSIAPNAPTGGDLGWKTNAILPPQIVNAINKITPNQTTHVITMPTGVFVFKLYEMRKHGTLQIVKQYHVRHILIKVNEFTSNQEAYNKINTIYNEIIKHKKNEQESVFIKLANQSSEDISGAKGGDIGFVNTGDLVPEFANIMVSLQPHEISKPTRTVFGWHLIQLLEVKDSNVADEKEKLQIKQEIRESRGQLLYTDWVNSLKKGAYIFIPNER